MELFNLIHVPWILVKNSTGEIQEISLEEALVNSEKYFDLAGETKTQDAAVFRVLEAVVLTILNRYDPQGEESELEDEEEALDRWETVWNEGSLPKAVVHEYLTSVQDKFYLNSDEHRFLQVKNALSGTKYKASKLTGDLSESENKVRLFQMRYGESKNELSLSEAARWLINLNAFDDTSAKASADYKKKPAEEKTSIGAGWLGKLGLVYLKGKNLFETLMLNAILLKDGKELWSSFTPYWELENPDLSERRVLSQAPDDLVALLTFPSRRIWLSINENGNVDGFSLIGGDYFDKTNAFSEQFTLWRNADPKGKKFDAFVPKRHRTKQLWRDFQFFTLPKKDNTNSKANAETKVPGIIQWIRVLISQDLLAGDTPIEICAPSVTYGDKDFFVTDISSASIRLFPKVLTDEGNEYRALLLKEVESIDKAAFALRIFVKKVMFAEGGSEETAQNSADQALEKFYALVDQPFIEWMATINPAEFTSEKTIENRVDQWHHKIWSICYQMKNSYLRTIRPEALIGKMIEEKDKKKKEEKHVSIPEAEDEFFRRIARIYQKKKTEAKTGTAL